MPLPVRTALALRPSSRTSSTMRSPCRASTIQTLSAAAWRAALVNASCTARSTASACSIEATRASAAIDRCTRGCGNGAASRSIAVRRSMPSYRRICWTTPRRSCSSSSANCAQTRTDSASPRWVSRASTPRLSLSAVSLCPATSCSSRDSRSRSWSRALSASKDRVARRSALTSASAARERSAAAA